MHRFIATCHDGLRSTTRPLPAHYTYYVTRNLRSSWTSIATSGSVHVITDDTPPITTDDAPVAWQNSDVTVTLTATDSGTDGGEPTGIKSITYTIDGSSPVVVDVTGAPTSGDTSVPIAAPGDHSNDGVHTIGYFATDVAGNAESSHDTTVKIDTQKPSTVASGVDGNWHNSVVIVHMAASDQVGLSGVLNVKYQVDGGSEQTHAAASGDVPDAAPAEHSNDGVHSVSYHATDNAGNIEDAGSVSVKIDTTAPSVTVTPGRVPDLNGWYNHPVTFSATGDEAGGSRVVSCDVPSSYSGPDSTNASVTMHCTDNAGNQGSGNSGSFKYDGTNPTGTLTSPGTGTVVGTVSLASTDAADATSGVASVSYSYCAGTGCSPSASIGSNATSVGGYPVSWDTTTLANGPYRLAATITDTAGNTHATTPVAVTVTNVYSFTVSNPGTQTAGQAFGGQTVQLEVNGHDAGGFNGSTYSGLHAVSFSGPGNAPNGAVPAYPASLSFDPSGRASIPSVSVTLFRAEATALTGSDSGNGISGTSGNFSVINAGLHHFAVSTPGSATAGSAFSATVTAQDQYNNTVTGHTGTIHFSSTDVQAVAGTGLPANYTFTAGAGQDNGVHTFTNGVTLKTAGSQTVSVNDTVQPGKTGTSGTITIAATTAAKLVFTTAPVSGAATSSPTIGPITVQQQDAFGNPVNAGAGGRAVALSSNSIDTPKLALTSGGSTVTSATIANGSSSVSVFYADTRAGTPTITANAGAGAFTSTQQEAITAGLAVGIILTSVTTPPLTPALTCTGSVGSLTCSSVGEGNGTTSLTAKISLADQFQNVVANTTAAAIGIDLSSAGAGTLAPTGLNALSIPINASETSASFTATRANGNNKTITVTAMIHGVAETLTITLSS